MISGDNVSCIVLERGSEDIALVQELSRVFAIIAQSPADLSYSFPTLVELRRRLKEGLERIDP
jgi:hypothetical protein